MTSFIQRSFAGGELSPALYARTDQVKYQTGLRTCRNFKVMRHGGVANRAGTYFVGEIKDSSKLARLIPFAFNSSQTYVLEFGNLSMRPIRQAAQLADVVATIIGATQANPVVITTSAAHGFATGDEVYIAAILGMTQLNARNFKITVITATTFSLQTMAGANLDGTAYSAYTSGGTASRIYTIATPYDQLDVNASELQYVQSADVVTLVHPTYAPRELARTGHTNWTLSTITFAPAIAAPATSAASGGAAGTASLSYQITAVATETYEESLPSATATIGSIIDPPTASAPISVTWAAVTGAQEYNVYKGQNGIFGFIGVASGTSFSDTGYTADTLNTPPQSRNPFNAVDNYPSTVTYFQQRRVFANTNTDTEKVWATRTGMFKNLCVSSPLQPDDAVTFRIPGRQVNAVRHLFEIGKLVVLTSGGEYTVEGDASGALTPVAINPRQQGYNGSASLAPILLGNNAIFLQSRGMIVRDLRYDITSNGYVGRDLTVFSSHLFEGYQIVDWAYQQVVDSIVWVVRNDGVLLGLTYLREHEIWGWHRHDTDGFVENVCVIPEGDEDAVYLIVRRTIGGATKRYIERMHSRRITDISVDAFFVDCGLTYDGRNTTTTTMTLTGGTNWTVDESLTLTASAAFFSAADVGNAIVLRSGTDYFSLNILAYISTTVVTGTPSKTVPTSLRAVATAVWDKAVDDLGGLWHLEGKTLAILADGNVVANGIDGKLYTVTNGSITPSLDRPYSIIHAGLPYTCDFETLDIDTPNAETKSDKQKFINEVTLHVQESRGIFAGADADHLEEFAQRTTENFGEPTRLLTGKAEIPILSSWNDNGRVFIRQKDPLPLTILAAIPAGFTGG